MVCSRHIMSFIECLVLSITLMETCNCFEFNSLVSNERANRVIQKRNGKKDCNLEMSKKKYVL